MKQHKNNCSHAAQYMCQREAERDLRKNVRFCVTTNNIGENYIENR